MREFIGAHGLDQLAGVQRDSAGLGGSLGANYGGEFGLWF